MADSLSRHVIALDAAQRVVASAVAEADRIGVPMCIAVTDVVGHLVAYARMDGAPLLSAQIAQDKAYSVAAFNDMPTHDWWNAIKDEPALRSGIVHTERLVVFGGGIPITVDGETVGAIGVSGGTTDQDRKVAEAAVGGRLA